MSEYINKIRFNTEVAEDFFAEKLAILRWAESSDLSASELFPNSRILREFA